MFRWLKERCRRKQETIDFGNDHHIIVNSLKTKEIQEEFDSLLVMSSLLEDFMSYSERIINKEKHLGVINIKFQLENVNIILSLICKINKLQSISCFYTKNKTTCLMNTNDNMLQTIKEIKKILGDK